MRPIIFFALLLCVTACTDVYLDQAEEGAFSEQPTIKPLEPTQAATLSKASAEAKLLSSAYYEAGVKSQRAQKLVNGAMILTAASVVAGSVQDVSEAALTNRGLAALTLQQAGARGLDKTSIHSLFDGAQTLNCVGAIATIYGRQPEWEINTEAAEVTLAVIREVRINVRRGLTRDLAEYSTLLTAFEAAIRGDEKEGAASRMSKSLQKPGKTDLLEYLGKLKGCVASPKVSAQGKDAKKT